MIQIPNRFTSLKKEQRAYGRIAICTLQKASLTVEACVILPAFLLAMTMLIGLIDIARVKVEAQAELMHQAKTMSMYAYTTSDLYEAPYIDLYNIQSYELPVKLFPFPSIRLAIRARVHAWVGRTPMDEPSGGIAHTEREALVYVTDRETVFHTDAQCTHLQLSIVQTEYERIKELRNAYGGRYAPCEKCCEADGYASDTKNGNEKLYYVTEKGNTYHASLHCGSLKRTTKLVEKTKTEGLTECQRCQSFHAAKR